MISVEDINRAKGSRKDTLDWAEEIVNKKRHVGQLETLRSLIAAAQNERHAAKPEELTMWQRVTGWCIRDLRLEP